MKQVLASAVEAEMGSLFFNGQEATTICTILIEMGYPQPPTPLQTDNNTAAGISNSTVKQRRSKAIDMRFYWIRDRVKQGQFLVYWKPGATNRADYFTKHHPPAHHRRMRRTYLDEAPP
jgi:predicted transposase YdaD